MKSPKTTSKIIISGVLSVFLSIIAPFTSQSAFADDEVRSVSSFSMSPMYERIVLNPGESYTSGFKIRATESATTDLKYKVYTQPFYRDDENMAMFEDVQGRTQITNWTTINTGTTGTVAPNESAEVVFTIKVPEDAPAGGQYMAITVSTDSTADPESMTGAVNIQENVAIAYTVYAEVTGTTIKQGEITDATVQSFLFSGNITGTSSIKNTGNVHGDAIYKLQVFPLFSNEEVYTNEESPETHLVLPDRTLYNETSWENTPWFGIFNVIYTVEFEGVISQVTKMVIVCPIWLLFIVIFAIIMLIIWLVLRSRSRKKSSRKAPLSSTTASDHDDPVNGPLK